MELSIGGALMHEKERHSSVDDFSRVTRGPSEAAVYEYEVASEITEGLPEDTKLSSFPTSFNFSIELWNDILILFHLTGNQVVFTGHSLQPSLRASFNPRLHFHL
jgi:hypothetical protein